MASTVLLIVLLDTLAEFPDILQEKLSKLQSNASYKVEQCEPKIVNFVLEKVRPGPGQTAIPSWILNQRNNLDDLTKRSEENHGVINENAENSSDLEYFHSIESVDNFINLNDARRAINIDDIKVDPQLSGKTKRTQNIPEGAPFLVAIFESVSNITAQTCAGTLLSRRWVVTSAGCVNVLSDLVRAKSNNTERSSYTVVVGSTNPFIDGTVHNVTEILLSHENFAKHHGIELKNYAASSSRKQQNPTLAMLMIDPGVPFGGIEVWRQGVAEGLELKVFGWTLIKNNTLDAMRPASSPAKIVTPSKCHSSSTSALCLSVENEKGSNIQMGSGGAVLVTVAHRTYMLAVALGEHAPMLAEPLANHARWIDQVLSGNINT